MNDVANKADPRDNFVDLIDLKSSRVLLSPHITFVCGGEVDITKTTNHSIRNMFMNLSGRMPEKSQGFTLAENFKDWQDGYSSLSDFENDIAAISSTIVVILESAGSLTELGLFYANVKLRKKMVVIVHSEHHISESFIKFGVLSPLEQQKPEAVLVYEIDSQRVEDIEESEVNDIVEEIWEISSKADESASFDVDNRGHVIFLIFQIIDLFTILTSKEVSDYLSRLKVRVSARELTSALYILQKFKLLRKEKRSSQTFYFIPPDIADRVNLKFKSEEKLNGTRIRHDKRAIKVKILDHYESNKSSNAGFRGRLKLWQRQDSMQ